MCNEHFKAILAKMADWVTNLSRTTSFCGAITSDVVVATRTALRYHATHCWITCQIFCVER